MAELPHLAYIGEVPIRRISAGPALLYRLLETYPAERLLVAESIHNEPDPPTELPGVRHERFFLMNTRLICSRFSPAYCTWVFHRGAHRARALLPALRAHKTEAVLTIAHGYGWITAAAAASRLGVPLHIICHDHLPSSVELPRWLRGRYEARFSSVYRAAKSRIPISPQMEEMYRRRYGAPGTIVYPSRSLDALRLDRPPLRPPTPGRFVFSYAGSANLGQRAAIIAFAKAIAPLGGRLRIYQKISLDLLKREGLAADNVEIAAFRPTNELHLDLVRNSDALFLPMSFAPEDRDNVGLCFPSKLADYTVAGLPILVCSPEYGTAAQWAKSIPGVAELVETLDPGAVAKAAARLIDDEGHRRRLAWAALEAGRSMFSQEAAFSVLSRCLLG
jgi:glycosyltransferase involved in cell wall biosynthesis